MELACKLTERNRVVGVQKAVQREQKKSSLGDLGVCTRGVQRLWEMSQKRARRGRVTARGESE
jgi:hypothetical protein